MSKLTKKERDTEIYYNQSGDPIQVRTHDAKLFRKLAALSEEFPELCQLTDEDEYSGSYFDVDKSCISIHVKKPYSEERRRKQSEWAKKNGMNGNRKKSLVGNLDKY